MPKRHQLREAIVQFLYFWEINKPPISELDHSLALIWEAFEFAPDAQEAAKSMILGVLQNLEAIDAVISKQLENWDISRLHKTDLTILRLAIYEFFHRPDIPPVVTMNEAIDLAKAFSNDESGKFINGILDKIAPTLGRSLRDGTK
jgi:N utilization substance protein B